MRNNNLPSQDYSSKDEIAWEGDGAPISSTDLGNGVTLEKRVIRLGPVGFGRKAFDFRFKPTEEQCKVVDDKKDK